MAALNSSPEQSGRLLLAGPDGGVEHAGRAGTAAQCVPVPGVTSTSSSTRAATRVAPAAGEVVMTGPRLGDRPRGTAPRPEARPAGRATLIAPADSPNTVTLSGSPPNPAMLSRTHSRAATWSRIPRLPVPSAPSKSSSRYKNPKAWSR